MTGNAADEFTKKCRAWRNDGSACRSFALRGQDFCFIHSLTDEERREAMLALTANRLKKQRVERENEKRVSVLTGLESEPVAEADSEPVVDATDEAARQIARAMRITPGQARERLEAFLAEPVRLYY